MNIELFRNYCLKKKGAIEDFPFDDSTLVLKVMGKAFALCSLEEQPPSCNLKCDPERAEELRERYDSIIPGYHMNKKHWNTVTWNADVPDPMIIELIDHSYDLVVKGLSGKLNEELLKLK